MCRRATVRVVSAIAWLAISLLVVLSTLQAQSGPASGIGWRHVGNAAMELSLPSLATGPVDRVWYSVDGANLYAKTSSGRVFMTSDFEQWQLVSDSKVSPPPEQIPTAAGVPEAGLKLATGAAAGKLYGVGRDVYRSDDGGVSWSNLTEYQRRVSFGQRPCVGGSIAERSRRCYRGIGHWSLAVRRWGAFLDRAQRVPAKFASGASVGFTGGHAGNSIVPGE